MLGADAGELGGSATSCKGWRKFVKESCLEQGTTRGAGQSAMYGGGSCQVSETALR